MGLLTQASVAIDGSKFKAVNNRDKDFTRAKMELRLRARPPKASYGAIKKHPGQRRGAVTQIRLLPDGPSGGTGRRDVQRTGTGLSVLFLLTSRQRPGPPRACLRGSDPAVADEGSPNVQAHRYPTDYPVVRSRREDGIVVIPAKLKGAAAHKVVDPLLTKGLVEEIRANGKLPVWRRDDSEGPFALRITKRGLHAIQVEPEGHAQDGTDVGRAKASKSSSAKRRQKPRAKASGRSSKRPSNPPGSPAEPRAGSKLALIVKMLERTRGSTIDDLTAATSWLPHTTRAVITSLRNKGYRVETERNRDHKIIYRIAAKKSPGQTRRAS
jgi:hypothetical protein